MRFSLLPKYIFPEVTAAEPEFFTGRGIRLVMLDFDNTLLPYTTNCPTEAVLQWLGKMKQAGILLCVVSNSHKDRVKDFCRQYGVDCITGACKPFSKGIRQCLNRYQIPASSCALIGDQIFTDTLGANLSGVTSVLVQSINNHTVWLKLRHVAEMPFILAAKKRRVVK